MQTLSPSPSLQEFSHFYFCPTEDSGLAQASKSPTHSNCNVSLCLQKVPNRTKLVGKQRADSGHDHFALPPKALVSQNEKCFPHLWTSLLPQDVWSFWRNHYYWGFWNRPSLQFYGFLTTFIHHSNMWSPLGATFYSLPSSCPQGAHTSSRGNGGGATVVGGGGDISSDSIVWPVYNMRKLSEMLRCSGNIQEWCQTQFVEVSPNWEDNAL